MLDCNIRSLVIFVRVNMKMNISLVVACVTCESKLDD